MSIFNGKCLIRFSYRRENGLWKLNCKPQSYTIDARVREKLQGALGRIECIGLPRAKEKNPDRMPFIHLDLLLAALAGVELDGGSVTEQFSGEPGSEGEAYAATIEVKERLERYRNG